MKYFSLVKVVYWKIRKETYITQNIRNFCYEKYFEGEWKKDKNNQFVPFFEALRQIWEGDILKKNPEKHETLKPSIEYLTP